MNPKVDDYLENVGKWQQELSLLRKIILGCGLTEDFKWMHPCYTLNDKNIVLLQEFKNYCAIMFQKGALLKDDKGILVKITENVQSARQIRFRDEKTIHQLEPAIRQYIFEAIEIEKAGLEVKMKTTSDFEVPEELLQQFEKNPDLKTAFENLTPGRQKGYLLHFSQPKQAKTRESRIIKNTERILKGKGLTDCICGLSRRFPGCDGSHKQLKKTGTKHSKHN